MVHFRSARTDGGDSGNHAIEISFFCSESKYGSGAADAVSDHFSIERSSAYRKKNRALENLTTLLYGKG